jgi:hypothetical protein
MNSIPSPTKTGFWQLQLRLNFLGSRGLNAELRLDLRWLDPNIHHSIAPIDLSTTADLLRYILPIDFDVSEVTIKLNIVCFLSDNWHFKSLDVNFDTELV